MKLFNKPFCIFHHQNSQSISHRSVRIKSKENKKNCKYDKEKNKKNKRKSREYLSVVREKERKMRET